MSKREQISSIKVQPHDLPMDATHPFTTPAGGYSCVAFGDTDTGDNYRWAFLYRSGMHIPSSDPDGINTFRNAIPNVRLRPTTSSTSALPKRFACNERADLRLRLDAFNALDHPNWNDGDNYSADPTNDNSGTIQKGPQSLGIACASLADLRKITF